MPRKAAPAIKPTLWSKALCSLFLATGLTTPADARDLERGASLAQGSCAVCHIVTRPKPEVAAAPPFEVIARQRAFDADRLFFAIVQPHRKMNLMVSPADARDIAAFMSSLAK